MFVIRPSRIVNIKRIERNVAKIQEMYDLGREDAINSMETLLEYLGLEKPQRKRLGESIQK